MGYSEKEESTYRLASHFFFRLEGDPMEYKDQSDCQNCGKRVYYGIKQFKNGRTEGTREWRHVDTGNMKCVGVIPRATPDDTTWMRVHDREVARGKKLYPWVYKNVPSTF